MSLLSSEEVRAAVARLEPWFHNLHLPGGVQTAPGHWLGDYPAVLWAQVAAHLPERLDGWSVLDVGCNAGAHSFELARRGARVLAIDVEEHYLRQARWAAGVLGLERSVDLRRLDVYELRRIERVFDLVVFTGVFYHLRHPLLGLDLVREKVGRLLVFQSMTLPRAEPLETPEDLAYERRAELARPGWPSMAFVEKSLAHDPTNWWIPDSACVPALLRSAGLRIVARCGEEVVLCEPTERPAAVGRELERAVGARGAGRMR